MTRRDLLKFAGACAVGWVSDVFNRTAEFGALFAGTRNEYDLVAVKNGSPDKLFDAGIKAFGGMTAFVKKGQTVLVKPNCAQVLGSEYAANTNPILLKRIIEHARNAGASKIYVFDHSLGSAQACYKNSGIEEATKSAGGIIVPADDKKYYHVKDIPHAKILKQAAFHEVFLEVDVVINVPILKHHWGTGLTMAMKNIMGVVWDRGFFHSNNLHQCIADLSLYRKPDLNVIDAYTIMTDNGPRGGSIQDTKIIKNQILSRDIVSADAAGAKIFGMEPEEIDYIRIAHEMKIGTKNLKDLNIARIVL